MAVNVCSRVATMLVLSMVPALTQALLYDYTVVKEQVSWTAAKAACQRRGGDLAIIPDMDHNRAVLAKLTEAKIEVAWLGLSDVNNEDAYVWVDGEDIQFTRWMGAAPTHGANNCAVIYGDAPSFSPGRWNDLTCDDRLDSISFLETAAKYCAVGPIALGDQQHGFGFTQATCAAETVADDRCEGSYFYFAPTYNGQCKCARLGDDCKNRGTSGLHNIYKVLENTGYVCGATPPTTSPTTSQPTTAPTKVPTSWFEHPGHLANTTELQTRMVTVELDTRDLKTTMDTQATSMTTMMAMMKDLTEKVDKLIVDVRLQGADAKALRSALESAVIASDNSAGGDGDGDGGAGCTTDCSPQLFANGMDLKLNALGGDITISSEKCGEIDLCDVSSFAVNLKAALRKV